MRMGRSFLKAQALGPKLIQVQRSLVLLTYWHDISEIDFRF